MPTCHCRNNLWPDVQVKSETAAGYAFACYDCELKEHGECIGYPCVTPPDVLDVFALLDFFSREGLSRREQGLALAGMGITRGDGEPYPEGWIFTFVCRRKNGGYVPPSFTRLTNFHSRVRGGN